MVVLRRLRAWLGFGMGRCSSFAPVDTYALHTRHLETQSYEPPTHLLTYSLMGIVS